MVELFTRLSHKSLSRKSLTKLLSKTDKIVKLLISQGVEEFVRFFFLKLIQFLL